MDTFRDREPVIVDTGAPDNCLCFRLRSRQRRLSRLFLKSRELDVEGDAASWCVPDPQAAIQVFDGTVHDP